MNPGDRKRQKRKLAKKLRLLAAKDGIIHRGGYTPWRYTPGITVYCKIEELNYYAKRNLGRQNADSSPQRQTADQISDVRSSPIAI